MKTNQAFLKKIKKNKLMLIIILALVIISTIAYFGVNIAKNFTEGGKEQPLKEVTLNQAENLPVTQDENPRIAGTSTDPTRENTINNETSIPIFMYHYIRVLNDPNDKIGTNLSVSPEKFSSELDLIKSKGYEAITFEDINNGNIPNKPIILTFDDGYKDFYQNAYSELKKRNMKAVSFIITNDIGQNEYMNNNEIKEISNYGIEIGSHTLSHPDLSKLSSAKAEIEIAQSKKNLEELISKNIISFCYPSGKYTPETENIVKTAGYKFATTTNSGITTFDNFFALNRYRINPDTNISSYLK